LQERQSKEVRYRLACDPKKNHYSGRKEIIPVSETPGADEPWFKEFHKNKKSDEAQNKEDCQIEKVHLEHKECHKQQPQGIEERGDLFFLHFRVHRLDNKLLYPILILLMEL
jgi:hypothetical protein